MTANPVLWSLDERGVATVTLNRPEVNNAYDGALIQGVLAAIDDLAKKPLRVVVLKGNGRHFQAGADLRWINSVRPQSPEENEAASRATFEAVQRLNTLPVPTVALVQGGCFGGGTGVISACDIVIAADNALFSITEVRWGLTAAIIIPPLCADRRTLWRGRSAPHRPGARGGEVRRARQHRRQGGRAVTRQRAGCTG